MQRTGHKIDTLELPKLKHNSSTRGSISCYLNFFQVPSDEATTQDLADEIENNSTF